MSLSVQFEPTGDLEKDYLAYCEILQLVERDEILDGITSEAVTFPNDEVHTYTALFARSFEWCLNKWDMIPLCKALVKCSRLLRIRFTNAGVTRDAFKLLVHAISRAPSVASLSIDFNPGGLFPDTAIRPPNPLFPQEILAEVNEQLLSIPSGIQSVFHLTKLQDISLRGAALNDEQCGHICTALETNIDLVSLNVYGNDLTDASATRFAELLRVNRRLTSLDLGGNHITDIGARALLDCLMPVVCGITLVAETREKISRFYPEMPSDFPQYPLLEDIVKAAREKEEQTTPRDNKKKDPRASVAGGKGKASKVLDPGQRLTAPFDCDVVKVSEYFNTFLLPGNGILWSLNLSNNSSLTHSTLRHALSFLEPSDEALVPHRYSSHTPAQSNITQPEAWLASASPSGSVTDRSDRSQGSEMEKKASGKKGAASPAAVTPKPKPTAKGSISRVGSAASSAQETVPEAAPPKDEPVKLRIVYDFLPSPLSCKGMWGGAMESLSLHNSRMDSKEVSRFSTAFEKYVFEKRARIKTEEEQLRLEQEAAAQEKKAKK